MNTFCNRSQTIIEEISAGKPVTATLEELTLCGSGVLKIGAKVRQIISVIAVDGRKFFDDDFAWVEWIDASFEPANRSERCHLIDAGKLLIGLRDSPSCDLSQSYKDIFPLDSHKILALCRIGRKRSLSEIPAFLSHTKGYATMNRQAFRKAVSAWLGEQPDAAEEQPLLPSFEDALDVFTGIDSAALRQAVRDPERSVRSMRAGLGLLGASIAYELEQERPDVLQLQTLRTAMLESAREIGDRLAEFGEQ